MTNARTQLEALIGAFRATGESDGVDRAEDRLHDLDLPPLVFVMGEGKFGKSSLINALVGRDVAPVSRIPKTWKIDVYAPADDGEDEHALLFHADGRQTGPLSIEAAQARCDAEERRLAETGETDLEAARWVCRLPAARGCWFVDTPGFAQFRATALRSLFAAPGAAGVEKEEAVVYDTFIHRADFLLWCFRASRLEDADTVEAVKDISKLDIPSAGLLTFADQVPEGDLPRVLERATAIYETDAHGILPTTSVGDGAAASLERIWATLALHGVLDGETKQRRHHDFTTQEVQGWLQRTQARVEALALNVRDVEKARMRVDRITERARSGLGDALRRAADHAMTSFTASLDGHWEVAVGDRDRFFGLVAEDPALPEFKRRLQREVDSARSSFLSEMRSVGAELEFQGVHVYRDGRVEKVTHEIRVGDAVAADTEVGALAIRATKQRSLGEIYASVADVGEDDLGAKIIGGVAGTIAVTFAGLWRLATNRFTALGRAKEEAEAWLSSAQEQVIQRFTKAIQPVRKRVTKDLGKAFRSANGCQASEAPRFGQAADAAAVRLESAGFCAHRGVRAVPCAIQFQRRYHEKTGGDARSWNTPRIRTWLELRILPLLEAHLGDGLWPEVADRALRESWDAARCLARDVGFFKRGRLRGELAIPERAIDLRQVIGNRILHAAHALSAYEGRRVTFVRSYDESVAKLRPTLISGAHIPPADELRWNWIENVGSAVANVAVSDDCIATAWCTEAIAGKPHPAPERERRLSIDVFTKRARRASADAIREFRGFAKTGSVDFQSTPRPGTRGSAIHDRVCPYCGEGRARGTTFCVHCEAQVPYESCPAASPRVLSAAKAGADGGSWVPEEAKRFCPRCGESREPGTVLCGVCSYEAPYSDCPRVDCPLPALPEPRRRRKWGGGRLVALSLSVLVLLVIGVIWYANTAPPGSSARETAREPSRPTELTPRVAPASPDPEPSVPPPVVEPVEEPPPPTPATTVPATPSAEGEAERAAALRAKARADGRREEMRGARSRWRQVERSASHAAASIANRAALEADRAERMRRIDAHDEATDLFEKARRNYEEALETARTDALDAYGRHYASARDAIRGTAASLRTHAGILDAKRLTKADGRPWTIDDLLEAADRTTLPPLASLVADQAALPAAPDRVSPGMLRSAKRLDEHAGRLVEKARALDAILEAAAAPHALHSAAADPTTPPSLIVAALLRTRGLDALAPLGFTALHEAAAAGHGEAVRLLLEAGGSCDLATATVPDEDHAGTEGHLVGLTPLGLAARAGHPDVVGALLDGGADIRARHREEFEGYEEKTTGVTVLHLAASRRHDRVVDVLLDRGARIEARTSNDETALHYAAHAGHASTIHLLCERGADTEARHFGGHTPLHCAVTWDRLDAMLALLKHRADPKARADAEWMIVHTAAAADATACLGAILDKVAAQEFKAKHGNRPLHVAALNDGPSAIRTLVRRGAKIESRNDAGRTPLHIAMSDGTPRVIEALLELGADRGAHDEGQETPLHCVALTDRVENARVFAPRRKELLQGDAHGWAPLHVAAAEGRLAMVTFLVRAGTPLDLRLGHESKRAPLHLAALAGHADMLRHLIRLGAMRRVQDAEYMTALHLAAWKGHVDCVRILLELQVDPRIRSEGGTTALDLARRKGHREVVAILERAMPRR